MRSVYNIHQRFIPVKYEAATPVLWSLATDKDSLWPHERWPRIRFEGPAVAGALGGHGPIRYRIHSREAHEVRFVMTQPWLWEGEHFFRIEPLENGVLFKHVVAGRVTLKGWWLWHLAVRWLHDALLEDSFDKAEEVLTGRVSRPSQWSPWVKFLRWLAGHVLHGKSTKV